jgi:uncharacterized protein YukE
MAGYASESQLCQGRKSVKSHRMKHADWMRMLEQLSEALAQSATEVARHEQTLASPLLTSDLSGERQVSWQRALERFADRLEECQARVAEAGCRANEAEAGLADQVTLMAAFRSRVKDIGRQLAKVPADL